MQPKFPLTNFEREILAQAERDSRAAEQANRAGFSITGTDGKPVGPLRGVSGKCGNEQAVAETIMHMHRNGLKSAAVYPYESFPAMARAARGNDNV